jgi:sulfur carrier protein
VVTTVYLNGEPRALELGSTVADVVDLLTVTQGVAVARNGEVVPRSAWDATVVETDDRLEILSVAPGG